jgi:glyoxylase-like metal-dependent hydrolase (beta-lactamase superfamily II)
MAFKTIAISDRYEIDLGGIRLETVSTPGHTPGHMCLYIRKDKILFTGDHVLFDITPNITDWPDVNDSLGEYLNSLEKVKQMDVTLALPAHRNNGDFYARVDELILHHKRRLSEVEHLLNSQRKCSNAYQIASEMTWDVAVNWNKFPESQKVFAVGEAMSHLDYLEAHGRITSIDSKGIRYFKLPLTAV